MKTLVLTAALGSLVFSAQLEAQREPAQPTVEAKSEAARKKSSWVTKLDKNGDGKLSKAEAGAKWDAMQKFDKDGDGSLGKSELTAISKSKAEKRDAAAKDQRRADRSAAIWKRLDSNGDGKLTSADRAWARVSKGDKDKNGVIDKAEYASLSKQWGLEKKAGERRRRSDRMTDGQRKFREDVGRKVRAGEMTREEAAKAWKEKFGGERGADRPAPRREKKSAGDRVRRKGKAGNKSDLERR